MVNVEVLKLNYPEVVADNYRYRDAVENHSSLERYGEIKSQIGLDIAW